MPGSHTHWEEATCTAQAAGIPEAAGGHRRRHQTDDTRGLARSTSAPGVSVLHGEIFRSIRGAHGTDTGLGCPPEDVWNAPQ